MIFHNFINLIAELILDETDEDVFPIEATDDSEEVSNYDEAPIL